MNFDFLEARFRKKSQEFRLLWLAYQLPAPSCGRVIHREVSDFAVTMVYVNTTFYINTFLN